MSAKTGVLLINLGTPDSPSVKDVRRYLFEFLNDPRVIDINPVGRFFLVNFLIIPFRAPKSAKVYKELWTEKGLPAGRQGSPIIIYGESVKEKLQKELGEEFEVELAMRYRNPSLDDVLAKMKKKNYQKIFIFPLFPQYASASTGSAIDKAMKIISKWWVIPELRIISQFYDDAGYINSVVEQGSKYNIDDYDHVLFSFHGLPLRQVNKAYEDGKPCDDHNCENEINQDNKYCYKAVCYATSRLIAERLNISNEKYTVSFQSRLDKDWLEPFSDKVVIEKAKSGAKKLLVFSPAFVADCLETTIEIGKEYQDLFVKHGGEKVQLVESLNDNPIWIKALKNMILKEV